MEHANRFAASASVGQSRGGYCDIHLLFSFPALLRVRARLHLLDTCILIKRFASLLAGPGTPAPHQHCVSSQVFQGSATRPDRLSECVLAWMSSRTDR